MLTGLALLMCLASLSPYGECSRFGGASLGIFDREYEELFIRSKLDGSIGLFSKVTYRGLALRTEAGYRWTLWTTSPKRPCGNKNSCVGTFHVEVDGPTEKQERREVALGLEEWMAFLAWQRRTINFGPDALFPDGCIDRDYVEECYLADDAVLWRGRGVGDGYVVGLRHDGCRKFETKYLKSYQRCHGVRVYRVITKDHSSIPVEDWGGSAYVEIGKLRSTIEGTMGGYRKNTMHASVRYDFIGVAGGVRSYPNANTSFGFVQVNVFVDKLIGKLMHGSL